MSWRPLRLFFVVLLFSSLCGCFRVYMPPFPKRIRIQHPSWDQPLQVLYHPSDDGIIADVIASASFAIQRVEQRWGNFRAALTIRVFPTHHSLEQAVQRRYTWLRAWARYQEIYIQSPRTWRRRPYHKDLLELLIHELTHVVMYQRCADVTNWHRKSIPTWFNEGMASVTARQGYRRLTVSLQKKMLTPQGRTLLRPTRRHLLTAKGQSEAYSIAHWQFVYFLRRWRHRGVQSILRDLKRGRSFAQAFRSVTNRSITQFQREFLRSFTALKASFFRRMPPRRQRKEQSPQAVDFLGKTLHRCEGQRPVVAP